VPDAEIPTWLTARMTHVFALAHLQGHPHAGDLVDHGVAALAGTLRDDRDGGWFTSVDRGGRPVETGKEAYTHVFVALAASSATAAGRPGGGDLLRDALGVVRTRFLPDGEDALLESYDRAWRTPEAYRGANSNMHAVEAFLAVGDVTGEEEWHDRALSIAQRIIDRSARGNGWRVVEHFTPDWQPDHGYNRTRPGDPFRPYGATIGHWFEWARLCASLHASLADPPEWLLESAEALVGAGVAQGWDVDGHPGFVYTVDWDGAPVVRQRMHWVLAEAIGAAAVLHRLTGRQRYADWYFDWWRHAAEHFVDRQDGSWHHELDPENRPAATVWAGKPDIYHALQATLIPRLPPAPALAPALRADHTLPR
jgi:mannose/cellobiose epimerase-like protein (N-acyl-D-glucosamine 2-epimerase family)